MLNDDQKFWVGVIAVLVFLPMIIYAGYWVRKNVNYTLLYEDLVKETIYQNVKQECLIGDEK